MSLYPRKYLNVGVFSSTAHSHSVKALNSANTANVRLYGDDGGVALTAGAYRTSVSRTLVTTAITTGDISIYGHQAQIKVNANVASSAWMGGLWGMAEVVAGKTVSNIAGVVGMVSLPSTAVINTSCYIAAFHAVGQDLAGTHSGKAAVLHVSTPLAGVWDALVAVVGATGVTATSYGTINASLALKVLVDGTTKYIPLYDAAG